MIFYRIKQGDKTVGWKRTQTDAKAAAKAIDDGEWAQEDIPTDSHGLCNWLNANAINFDAGDTDYREGINDKGMTIASPKALAAKSSKKK